MVAFLARALVLALPCTVLAQIAVLQIKVLEGEGAVHTAGSRAMRPLTVAVSDETGRPVPGASVSFLLPDEGPGGMFESGLRTELAITDTNGRASVRNLRLNRTPGPFEIRISVVKEQVRAGMVSFQYISDVKGGAPARATSRLRRKWLILLLAAAGGGIAAGTLGGSDGSAAAGPPLSVGTPTITVGKP